MTTSEAVVMFQQALSMALLLAAPMLLFGLAAGLIISVFQAATQIQEMTLSFIPKVLAVVLSLFLFLPWMLARMTEYTTQIFARIASLR